MEKKTYGEIAEGGGWCRCEGKGIKYIPRNGVLIQYMLEGKLAWWRAKGNLKSYITYINEENR